MQTIEKNQTPDLSGPLGHLKAASEASAASAALASLLDRGEANLAPLSRFARLLPALMSVESLLDVKPAYVDSRSLVVLSSAIANVDLQMQAKPSVMQVAQMLGEVQADLELLSKNEVLPKSRIEVLRSFCLMLAEQLVDQVPIPAAQAGGQRV